MSSSRLEKPSKEVGKKLKKACQLRLKHITPLNQSWEPKFDLDNSPPDSYKVPKTLTGNLKNVDGVFQFESADAKFAHDFSLEDFLADYRELVEIMNDGETRTYCHGQLKQLEFDYELYRLNPTNTKNEQDDMKISPLDFHSAAKCDNHIHLSAAMSQDHLLDFIKRKAIEEEDTPVLKTKDGKEITMQEALKAENIDAATIDLDDLCCHGFDAYQRFDLFNASFSPMGNHTIKDIFLSTKMIATKEDKAPGRLKAELIKEVFKRSYEHRNCYFEPRVSIKGLKADEWKSTAVWVMNHKLHSPCMRWMIQVPRIYPLWKSMDKVQNFGTMVDNFFRPLFEVTVKPESDPTLFKFLQYVVGFDSVDDEGSPDIGMEIFPKPNEWKRKENPPYEYWSYYWSANISVLNKLRHARGLNTFAYRPHCGETGNINHLPAAFLTSNSINHGIQLIQQSVIMYLYYLTQIPVSVSPISNNVLFESYHRNPFPIFFKTGLHVTLSTDDPLIIHMTTDALMEEYSMAHQIWRLTAPEMAEISRNSIRHSGFELSKKIKLLGENWEQKANTKIAYFSQTRLNYRMKTLNQERKECSIQSVIEELENRTQNCGKKQ